MFTRFTVLFRLVFVVAALAVPLSAMSQSFYGSLVAVVEDPQGGVMPGASIVLVNTATSERREGVSAEDGTYRFVNLVPGTYRLEVELTGFQRYVRDQIQVSVQTTPRIAVTLQLGSLQETISVSGEAPQLQTESASVGTIVGTRAVQELPLNGRNVLNLITVAPTVVPQGGSEGSLTGKNVFAAGNYQIGGGVANQSATLYDGVPLQDTAYGNIVVLTPSPEAVEEFRVQTNNSSAEFGRFTGGVINMASRSGTNAFRGSAFEYFRNKALNSNTFFGERAGLDKPPFTQNNFGGVLGGPVLKNKLFFFSSYEGYRNREGVLFRRTVPTAPMKRGDFSDYRNLATGALVPIYDPWTQCGIVNPGSGAYNGDCGTVPNRLQFPGNVIPANRVSAIARNYLNFPVYAEPTVPGPWRTENFERNAEVGGDNDQFSLRGDYNLGQKQRLLGRYTRFMSTNLPVDVYGNGQLQGDPYSPEHFITTQVMAAHTYTLNASTVLDVRFGFLRWDYDRTPGNLGINLTQTFGLPHDSLRPDFRAQRNSRNGNNPDHRGGFEQLHQHRSAVRRQQVVLGDADADEDCRPSHDQVRRQHLVGHGRLLPEQLDGRDVQFQQRAHGARRHQPRGDGRSVRIVPPGHPDRRHLPVVGVDLRAHELPRVLRR